MDEYGHSSSNSVQAQFLESLLVESTNASSPVWMMSLLSRLKVRMSPLLYKHGQESPGKTHEQAQEPERIDQDRRCRWRKFRRIRWAGLGGGVIGEEMINISEIERRGVLWILLKAWDGKGKKCCKSD